MQLKSSNIRLLYLLVVVCVRIVDCTLDYSCCSRSFLVSPASSAAEVFASCGLQVLGHVPDADGLAAPFAFLLLKLLVLVLMLLLS